LDNYCIIIFGRFYTQEDEDDDLDLEDLHNCISTWKKKDPDDIKKNPDDIKKDPDDIIKDPDDIKKDPNDIKKDSDDIKKGPDDIKKDTFKSLYSDSWQYFRF
jgi:hypothetical protein